MNWNTNPLVEGKKPVAPSQQPPPTSTKKVSAREKLLVWSSRKTKGYKGVEILNFTSSWQDGLAFGALLHHFKPNLINFQSLSHNNSKQNLETVFSIYETLGIPKLLDPNTVATNPEQLSIITYVAQIFALFATPEEKA